MNDDSPTGQQRASVHHYRQMATNYVNDDYFTRNRVRLSGAISDRARGVESAHEVRNRLIIEAYAQAAERAALAGEDVEAALDQAEIELNEIVSLQSRAAGSGYQESGYLGRNTDRLNVLLDNAADGGKLSPSDLREALQRVCIDENCHHLTASVERDTTSRGKISLKGAAQAWQNQRTVESPGW